MQNMYPQVCLPRQFPVNFLMTAPFIYTALNVPTVSTYPSPSCLQWTGNGQVCFVTKTAVYILVFHFPKQLFHPFCFPHSRIIVTESSRKFQTPELGINFDTSSVIRAPVVQDPASNEQKTLVDVGWFRTMIEFNKGHVRAWTEGSQGMLTVYTWMNIFLGGDCRLFVFVPT